MKKGPAIVCCFSHHFNVVANYKGRNYVFDFSPMFGPLFLDRVDGDPLDPQPSIRTRAWKAFQEWYDAGNFAKANEV
ncbi:MAG: hypothetical protein IT364_02935 [Candidatus Hydrogenedentes bacterium]|nr:hypothetical protein [Candidatus Hydrogenedentota bacterium]